MVDGESSIIKKNSKVSDITIKVLHGYVPVEGCGTLN